MTFRLFADPSGKDYLGELLVDYKNDNISFQYTLNRDFDIDFNLRGDITVDFFISDGENSTLVDCVFYYEKYMYDHCCPGGICSGCDVPFPGVIFNNRKFNEPDPHLSLKEGFNEVLIPLRGENHRPIEAPRLKMEAGDENGGFLFSSDQTYVDPQWAESVDLNSSIPFYFDETRPDSASGKSADSAE